MTELLSPVQKVDQSTIDLLDEFELKGSINSEQNVHRKLRSPSEEVQSQNVDKEEDVIYIQPTTVSKDLKKDIPVKRSLASGPGENGFYGNLWMDIQNFEWDAPLIAGSDVDIMVNSYNTSGIFSIEIWEWNTNGWHPDIEEFSLVAVIANSVSLPDGSDIILTQDPNSYYPPEQQEGILTVTLPMDLPFRCVNNLLNNISHVEL